MQIQACIHAAIASRYHAGTAPPTFPAAEPFSLKRFLPQKVMLNNEIECAGGCVKSASPSASMPTKAQFGFTYTH
jgi:hypothetical protein